MEKEEVTVGQLRKLDISDGSKLKVHRHILGVPTVMPTIWGDIVCDGADTKFAITSCSSGAACLSPGVYNVIGTVKLDGSAGLILQEGIEYRGYQLLFLDGGSNKKWPITIINE